MSEAQFEAFACLLAPVCLKSCVYSKHKVLALRRQLFVGLVLFGWGFGFGQR